MFKTTENSRQSNRELRPGAASWFDTVRSFTERLMAIPTVSPDPAGEGRCAAEIARLLEGETELKAERWPTHDGRDNVACLLRGQHPENNGRTIILMGHYDTVGVAEFKALDPERTGNIAYRPDDLRQVILEKLRETRAVDEEEVWRDLNETIDGSDVWLFGRGSCDMKSGVAINIALMRHLWHIRAQMAGNVLFLACPDEENESSGVRSAVTQLLSVREQNSLDYLGLVNTDYAAPRNERDSGQSIYTGTVGKLLPSFYILGVPTHVGDPFGGVDASQIAAELVQRINLNVDLCDQWSADAPDLYGETRVEQGVPPITLKVRDLKTEYNVQTATEAYMYVNWLTFTTTPARALAVMRQQARRALRAVLHQRNEQYQRYANSGVLPQQYEPRVLSLEDLEQLVRARYGWEEDDIAFQQLMNVISAEADAEIAPHTNNEEQARLRLGYYPDSRTKTRLMVAKLIHYARLKGPAVVVFFAPPYYPHVAPRRNAVTEAFVNILNERHAAGNDRQIRLQGFYPYISDLSFVCLDDNIQEHLAALEKNMPVFKRGYTLDFSAMSELALPVMNIGPWGKDAHGLYERVHMPYSFETVPELIYEAITRVLSCAVPKT